MRWDIFEPLNGVSNPAEPGKYLGSVDISEKSENGINPEIMRLDLHLRKSRRKAYSESYGLITDIKKYNGGF